jgi:glycosyltransferase involved in cell wall biosynthesis
MNTPIVSVCMITYNHEQFISQAIKGVLIQKTNFPIELIISEDCSTDNTRIIIENYQKKIPDIIKADLPDHNRGTINNFKHNLSLAKGKYIALCEGDDYWTDPLKLQKQFDFMEAHPEYSLCFHNTIIHYEDSNKKDRLFAELGNREYTKQELTKRWLAPTASFFFRKSILHSQLYKAITQSRKLAVGDEPLLMATSYYGRIRGMDAVMSVYRKHKSGIMMQFDNEHYELCQHCIEMKRLMGDDLKSIWGLRTAKYAAIAISIMRKGRWKYGFKLWKLAVTHEPQKGLIESMRYFTKGIKNFINHNQKI